MLPSSCLREGEEAGWLEGVQMKQLSSRELDDGLSLLEEELALDEPFDGCAIPSGDIAWVWSEGEMSCVTDFLLSKNRGD